MPKGLSLKMDDKPTQTLYAEWQGHLDVVAHRSVAQQRGLCPVKLRQHRRADALSNDSAEKKLSGRQPPCHCRAYSSTNRKGQVLLDVGADVRADADDLCALCVDGDILLPVNGHGYRNARAIGLLNVGTEEATRAGTS